MKFSDYQIDDKLKDNLQILGFKRPTDIQYRAIYPVLKGDDVFAIAQTGTGKTAAFVIPVLQHLIAMQHTRAKEGVKCIVMAPTHELAQQINRVFEQIGKGTGIQSVAVIGGVEQDSQVKKLNNGAEIVVATPGRLFDLCHQGYLKLDAVKILVLDEADHMLAMGFGKDVSDLIRKIPEKRQTLFFSATINPEIKKLAYNVVKNAIRIEISPKERISKNISHSIVFVEMDHKRFFLERLITQNPDFKIMVFVRTRVRAERVAAAMERVQIKTLTMHGEKDHEQRNLALTAFRNSECNILIATDVSARGIDIPQIDLVVNYDMPDVPENYIHRIGRTGRGTHKGTAYSFCSSEEKEFLAEIQEYIDTEIDVIDIDYNSYQDTLDFTNDTGVNNWKKLIQDAEKQEYKPKKKKKK